MYPEPLPHQTHESAPKRGWKRRAAPAPETAPAGLRLAALDRTINVSDALNHPDIAMLMTEDFCWQTALADWRARRPQRWHRSDRRAWRAEKALLDQKRSRIHDLAAELGLIRDR